VPAKEHARRFNNRQAGNWAGLAYTDPKMGWQCRARGRLAWLASNWPAIRAGRKTRATRHTVNRAAWEHLAEVGQHSWQWANQHSRYESKLAVLAP